MNLFDICIITASNQRQAETFRRLLDTRISAGLYPREIDFRVYSDPEAGRVGSGGGTLCALLGLLRDHDALSDPFAFFRDKRILLIHAGGESRRLPCYAPEGKIFAPVPLATSSIIPPVVLDVQLSMFLKYPWKEGETIVISGDVVFDFDPGCVPDARGDVCGFAKPASVEQGARHGVFRFDKNRRQVLDFYQKASPEFLLKNAVLEGTTDCGLDMGIVSFSPSAAAAYMGLAQAPASDGANVGDAVGRGALSFDLYLEVLTACLAALTLEQYVERVAVRSSLDETALGAIYRAFHIFSLGGVLTRSTTFLHFGALGEIARSCLELHSRGLQPFYAQDQEELVPVVTPELVLYNSVNFNVPAGRHLAVCVEAARGCMLSNVMGNNLLFGLTDWSSSMIIPEGICIDERRVGGAVVRLVYGVADTYRVQKRPEDVVFCGTPLREWLTAHDLTSDDLWGSGRPFDLLTARLFVGNSTDEFLAGYWQKPFDASWTAAFRSGIRHSIAEVNQNDSAVDRESRRMEIRADILRGRLEGGVGWRNIPQHDFAHVASSGELRKRLAGMCRSTDDGLLLAYRRRLLGDGEASSSDGSVGFEIDYVDETARSRALTASVKEDQIVWARSPVRFDLGGGWSDTPPYTLSFGGQVTNIAVDLNGQPPIQVFCRRSTDRHIRVHSIDLGVTETFTTFEQLADYRDPTSPFGLPKAALCLLGLTKEKYGAGSLTKCLDKMGCGIEITLLCAVPKGSGLGTSSVLGAAILGALLRFFGRPVVRNELFRQVLQMEQMLTTGGGWQDQIGGVVGGVKYIESAAGHRPSPVIHQLDPWLFQSPQVYSCFTLFYTGITRLAKNILQDVVSNVNSRTPAYFFTLNHIRSLSVLAREAIELRDLNRLARVVAASWEANKLIHPSTTNSEVEALLNATRPHFAGAKLLGAGGGGYALFVSPTPEEADRLRDVLRTNFEARKARIVDFSLDPEGLRVTVS